MAVPGSQPSTETTAEARARLRAERRAERRRRRGEFVHKFRWAIYIAFISFMVFMAVCIILGVALNLDERYPELDLPTGAASAGPALDPLQLRSCLQALLRMRDEELSQVQGAFTGLLDRDAFLARHKAWERDWRARFDGLGLSCRLTGARPPGQPILDTLAELYRRLDYIQAQHSLLVRRYLTQNARTMKEIRELGERAGSQLDGQLQGSSPVP
ncbi:MAG TPA: hypothetical protein PK668_25900 [Myxococcota bacterium]|nr:hypothetical protein [Myxococcota bacterium]HRY96962.1 hypothetical protein [Myxococcota bacterium]HSA22396.1 hypothetical protein [Myxococcota bacterium]